jgi:hypothetical protein
VHSLPIPLIGVWVISRYLFNASAIGGGSIISYLVFWRRYARVLIQKRIPVTVATSLWTAHESTRRALIAAYNLRVVVKAADSWYHESFEHGWKLYVEFRNKEAACHNALMEVRALFAAANSLESLMLEDGPLVRLGRVSATNWHDAVAKFINRVSYATESSFEKEAIEHPEEFLCLGRTPELFRTSNVRWALNDALNGKKGTLNIDRVQEIEARLDIEYATARRILNDPEFMQHMELTLNSPKEFTKITKGALCKQLGVSSSSLRNRLRTETIPMHPDDMKTENKSRQTIRVETKWLEDNTKSSD